MTPITIHRVATDDTDRLQQIGRQTFYETFAAVNSPENMARYLEESFAAEKLAAELQNPNTAFYFALHAEKVIGYLKLNEDRAQTEIQEGRALEIERIYVAQAFHGRQVGQLLFEQALKVARQNTSDYIWLGVWEENRRAVAFYKKNGFIPFGTHIFTLGTAQQTDLMMKLEL